MIKVKLIEKTKDKSGDLKRVPKSEKEIKKNENYNDFISEISKAFSIPKNKFILKVLTEDEDDYAINDQEDLDSYIEEAREFWIIMEEGSEKTKSSKKAKEEEKKNNDSDKDDDKNDNDNNKDGDEKKDDEEEEEDGYLKKINIKVNLEMSEQEIENIMNSVKMPEIDEINDEVEFNIEKYKEDLNNMNNTKIGNFKKSFEDDINNIIKQKSTIIKQNISQLVLNNQKEQNKNLESIDEEISSVKKDFDEIIKNTSEMNNAIGDLNFRITGERNEFSEIKVENQNDFEGGANDMILQEGDDELKNEDQMIKFEEEEIKQDIIIKKAKFFEIENIKIFNIGNKEFKNLFFEIDTNNSSKDLLFYENTKNNTSHKLSLNGPLQKGDNLNNIVTFYIKNPKIQEYTITIYAREKPNGENLSSPLKINIKLIEDPKVKKEEEEKKRKEEEERKRKEEEEKKRIEEEEKKRKEEEEKKRKEEEEKKRKEEEEKKRKEEEEKKRIEEEEKNKQKSVQPGGEGEVAGKKPNVKVDYKGLNENEVKKMFEELEVEYNLSSILDEEEVLNKIVECNCNREEMNKWIEDNL